jgi:S-adenosylmethionine decarboxylase proenzyme
MKLNKIYGLHIVGDLYECDFSFFAHKSEKDIKKEFSKIILNNNLRELGNFYYFFSGQDSFTAVIALAESHLSIHTWPEDGYISLDVFVCNYYDNKENDARLLFNDIVNIFSPKKIIKKEIIR